MKAELYGLCNNQGLWQWRVTLDYETDLAMLPVTPDACTGAVRFMPQVSLGQAVYLAAKLQRNCHENTKLTDIWREFVTGCREAGMNRENLARFSMNHSPFHTQASTSSRAPLNLRVLDQLIRILAGRSLLPEELAGLMEIAGLSEWQA
ncbi:MAG: hypothetical protein K0Q90_4691, partial [Paenibacillaceae bacterium]|nr:hypothetical protein [Paenibacillaceae bacterium]